MLTYLPLRAFSRSLLRNMHYVKTQRQQLLTCGPGTGMSTSLSSLPGRRRAGSMALGRLVAAMMVRRPPKSAGSAAACQCCTIGIASSSSCSRAKWLQQLSPDLYKQYWLVNAAVMGVQAANVTAAMLTAVTAARPFRSAGSRRAG